jgi:hypothetical protein
VHITDAPYAVDQEDLLEKLVFAEFVFGYLHQKASFLVLPSQVGKLTNFYGRTHLSVNFKEISNGN